MQEEEAKGLIENINEIQDSKEYDHVIYITSVVRTLNLSIKGFHIDTLENLEMDSRLNVVNENIFSKITQDAFENEALVDFIRRNNINQIDLTGLLGEHCIYSTAMGGLDLGLEVNIIEKAVAWKE